MKFIKVFSDHVQAVEEILVALVLPDDSVSLLSLKRGDNSQRRSLIYPSEPQHVTVSVGPRLPISFFLDPVSVRELLSEEVKDRVLMSQSILKSGGLCSDGRLQRHLVDDVGDELYLLEIPLIGEHELVAI
jgi:hypothetical protein